MLRIGEFSKLTKTTVKTLRYYDKVGLLKPAFVDEATGYRYYTEEQLETMQQIHSYKAVGMSNDEILRILSGMDPVEALLTRRRLLKDNIKEMSRQLEDIERILDQAGRQDYQVTLKDIGKCTVCYCRGYISDVSHIRSFMQACHAELRRTNPEIQYAKPDYCCVIYPGESYRETDIFIEYAQSVDRIGTETPMLKFKNLDPVTAVSVEHRGGYEHLRNAYLFAIRWAAENGYTICGDARERYIDGAWNREKEEQWLTEVQLPVEKKEDESE